MYEMLYLDTLTDHNGHEYVNVPAEPYQLVQMGFSWAEAHELQQKALNQRRLKIQTQQKQGLLEEARRYMGPLQDAVELGMATEEEAATLQSLESVSRRTPSPTAL